MTAALTDRFHLLARAGQYEKTPIRAETPSLKAADGTVMLRLYDVIDSWGGPYGVSAKEFADVLDGLPDDTTEIQLHINSPGGETSEAIAILNLLRQHQAKVIVTVDGLAASAASFIAMAGDEIVMARNSEIMIHDAWGVCVGNAADMQAFVDLLNHLCDNMARIYAARAGGSVEEWRAVMAAETWFSDEEAVASGLADRVLDDTPADQPKARFDLSVFAYAGRAKAPAPTAPAAAASGRAAAGGTTPKENATMADTFTDGLRQRLGIADDADEATILAALDEALTEKAETPAAPEEPAIPEGHVVVPEARLRDLEAGATAGTQAAKKLHDQERDAFLNSVRAKFAPANRAAWEAEYDRDPEGTRKHFETAPEIVALAPIGHDDDPELSALDADYRALFGDEKVS